MGMDDEVQAAAHGRTPAEADLRPEVTHLLEAALRQRDAGHLVDAIVAAAQSHLGMEVAFLSRFAGDREEYLATAGEGGSFGVAPGGAVALSESYCARMVRGDLPSAIPDAAGDPRVNRMPATGEHDIGAYVGVPVRMPDGEPFGSLCALSHSARPDIDERDVGFLRVLAAVIAGELGRDAGRTAGRRAVAEHIAGILRRGRVTICFQPIVRLADGATAGVEALARFGGSPERRPDAWFADAWDMGAGPELELLAVREALAASGRLPDGAYLSINVDQRTAVSAAFAELLDGRSDRRRILVELTEHALVHGYEGLRETMRRLRRSNVRFAVDDVGAGYSGLSHIVEVAPRRHQARPLPDRRPGGRSRPPGARHGGRGVRRGHQGPAHRVGRGARGGPGDAPRHRGAARPGGSCSGARKSSTGRRRRDERQRRLGRGAGLRLAVAERQRRLGGGAGLTRAVASTSCGVGNPGGGRRFAIP